VRGILQCGSTTGSVSPSSNPLRAWFAAGSRPLLHRWSYTAALVVGLLAVFVSPSGRDIEDLVQLERLGPKIERAQTLSAEAREAIERLLPGKPWLPARMIKRIRCGERRQSNA
jgi:hypothetical protein